MVWDEATSALDSKTEASIVSSLNALSKDRTSLVVAHRLSTIMNSDKILVMDKGLVIEEGTHESLLEKKGKYYELWVTQQKE